MDAVLEYMINKEWKKDYKYERKIHLLKLAKEGIDGDNISNKIGSMLICSQVVEQFLKEVILCSVAYIKAEIWPSEIELSLDFEKATFGNLITMFKRFAVKTHHRDEIVLKLKELNTLRNEVVHKLFDIEDIEVLGEILNGYYDSAFDTISMLSKYYGEVCWYLNDLDNRVEFDSLCDDV